MASALPLTKHAQKYSTRGQKFNPSDGGDNDGKHYTMSRSSFVKAEWVRSNLTASQYYSIKYKKFDNIGVGFSNFEGRGNLS